MFCALCCLFPHDFLTFFCSLLDKSLIHFNFPSSFHFLFQTISDRNQHYPHLYHLVHITHLFQNDGIELLTIPFCHYRNDHVTTETLPYVLVVTVSVVTVSVVTILTKFEHKYIIQIGR